MKNFRLSESDIAEHMKTTPERVAGILAGSEPFTLDDAKNLKKHFGAAAVSLIRQEAMRDFFDGHGRRPNDAEKEKLFAPLVL